MSIVRYPSPRGVRRRQVGFCVLCSLVVRLFADTGKRCSSTASHVCKRLRHAEVCRLSSLVRQFWVNLALGPSSSRVSRVDVGRNEEEFRGRGAPRPPYDPGNVTIEYMKGVNKVKRYKFASIAPGWLLACEGWAKLPSRFREIVRGPPCNANRAGTCKTHQVLQWSAYWS